jgi:hypothetical protein
MEITAPSIIQYAARLLPNHNSPNDLLVESQLASGVHREACAEQGGVGEVAAARGEQGGARKRADVLEFAAMTGAVWFTILLSIPLSILANAMTPRVLNWTATWSRRRARQRVADLSQEMKDVQSMSELRSLKIALKTIVLASIFASFGSIALLCQYSMNVVLFRIPAVGAFLDKIAGPPNVKITYFDIVFIFELLIMLGIPMMISVQTLMKGYRILVRDDVVYIAELQQQIELLCRRFPVDKPTDNSETSTKAASSQE